MPPRTYGVLSKLPVAASLTCPPAGSTTSDDIGDIGDTDDTEGAEDVAGADDTAVAVDAVDGVDGVEGAAVVGDMDEVLDTTLACSVTCGDGLAEGVPPAGRSEVALADGTNHRAHSRVPAAVAVSNGRRADDTEYRSPCGAG